MAHDDLHDHIAAYALDALDENQRRAYEAHVAACPECRAELRALNGTVGALGLAAEGPPLPDGLRGRLLEAARREGPANVVAIRSRRRGLLAGAAAVAAAAAVAIGLWVGLSGNGSGNRQAISVSVEQGVARLTATGFAAAPAGKQYEIWVIGGAAPKRAGLFSGGDTQVVTLTRPVPNGSKVAVTLERAGGVEAPTTPIIRTTTVSA